MKNIEMVELYNKLNEFVQKDKVIPIKVSYIISKNMNLLSSELKPYEEARQKLVMDYDVKSDEEKRKIESELSELLMIDCDVNLYKMSFEELEKCDGVSTKEFMLLEQLVAE